MLLYLTMLTKVVMYIRYGTQLRIDGTLPSWKFDPEDLKFETISLLPRKQNRPDG